MSWVALREAIQAATVAATGLATARVLWGFQDFNQPAGAFAELNILTSINPGQDGIVEDYDAGRAAGQEIRRTVVGVREITIVFEFYAARVLGNGVEPDSQELAERFTASLSLQSVRDLLTAAAVAPIDIGAVNNLPAIEDAKFRARSVVEVRANVPAQAVVEYTGYIANVGGSLTVTGTRPTSPTVFPIEIP